MEKIMILFSTLILFMASCSTTKDSIDIANESPYINTTHINELDLLDQDKAVYFSAIGYQKEAVDAFAGGCPPHSFSDESIQEFKDLYKPINANRLILQKADSNEIIYVNRNDHLNKNHVFVSNLLSGLYLKGYKQIGMEGISNVINKGNFSSVEVSLKLKSPQFANLIRNAIKLGFEVFPVDHLDMRKELNGLENNMAEISKRIKHSKILLYGSIVNSVNRQLGRIGWTLSSLIKAKINIALLSIDQVVFDERSSSYYERHMYKLFPVEEPTVYINDNLDSYHPPKKTHHYNDIYIFHPRTKYINNRPDWLMNKGVSPSVISLRDINPNFPVLISAYKKERNCLGKIPWDITEVSEDAENVSLFLPTGSYDIVLQNNLDETKSIKLKVK